MESNDRKLVKWIDCIQIINDRTLEKWFAWIPLATLTTFLREWQSKFCSVIKLKYKMLSLDTRLSNDKLRREKLIMELHLRAERWHLHSITYHPTQVNIPTLNPSETGWWYSIYLPQRDERLSGPRWLVTYQDDLPAHRRSPIQVPTQQCTAGSWTCNLLIISPTP